ncbi:hypothetical protein [Stygiolobus caldivivus]|uniref:Uncharacterized protein n=1 Tax=Stygiolobus caldivivus TaxID=2824673 RepID=A0A8D5ZHQ5_9CREN|nr:hypothetical protein [Stygiolobus caldivivus]BCU68805.1 hypothetical protein KN1_01020 [Stygiolobus caldivivus]
MKRKDKENKLDRKKKAVSNVVFGAAVIILLIIAAIGFYLYATKPSVTTTVKTTYTHTVPMMYNLSAAFLNGQVITFNYTMDFSCNTSGITIFANESQQESVADGCEVGQGLPSSDLPSNAAPVYVIVPAFAGLSIFGVQKLGANAQGFPTFTYNGTTYTVLTQCGAADTPAACPDHMSLIYSPAFTAVEESLGIKNGVFGLPEGVLPTPAHDHIVTFSTTQSIPWYIVVVLVFNPNIFPNPLTGQCEQIVPSNVTNDTSLCLNSYANLQKALSTYDSAVLMANQNNPIWKTLLNGKAVDAIEVPSNMILYFSDPNVYPYPDAYYTYTSS